MTLSVLVNNLFRKIHKPSYEEPVLGNSNVLTAIDPGDNWEDAGIALAGMPETEGTYNTAYSVGKSWEHPPVVRQGKLKLTINGEEKYIGGIFPQGQVGTYNMGLPPIIATYLQALRKRDISIEDSQDISTSITTLYLPLVLGKILADIGSLDQLDNLGLKISFKHKTTGKEIEL